MCLVLLFLFCSSPLSREEKPLHKSLPTDMLANVSLQQIHSLRQQSHLRAIAETSQPRSVWPKTRSLIHRSLFSRVEKCCRFRSSVHHLLLLPHTGCNTFSRLCSVNSSQKTQTHTPRRYRFMRTRSRSHTHARTQAALRRCGIIN